MIWASIRRHIAGESLRADAHAPFVRCASVIGFHPTTHQRMAVLPHPKRMR